VRCAHAIVDAVRTLGLQIGAGVHTTESTGGQLLYQFRRPWRDGSTALLLEPLELLERLAALFMGLAASAGNPCLGHLADVPVHEHGAYQPGKCP
jgi:hypothetical protein